MNTSTPKQSLSSRILVAAFPLPRTLNNASNQPGPSQDQLRPRARRGDRDVFHLAARDVRTMDRYGSV